MYKIRLQRYFFETCNKSWTQCTLLGPRTNGQSNKAFLLTSEFCPQRVICPCPVAIYMWKNIKKCVKNQNSKKFVWNLQQMVEVIWAFCWHQKFVPKGFSVFAPVLYACIKSLKVCIKSDFEEIILKLPTYGQRERAFLLSSDFVCPYPGLYIYLNRLMTKPTKWHVRPAKTLISLGIGTVWSESLLCSQWVS